jgi:hypothetical protein
MPDMLEQLFDLQARLNQRIGYDTKGLRERFDPLTAGRWLNDYIMAAANELEELRDCTFWKHWCSEAARGQRFALYLQKLEVNHKRQDGDYSMKTKTEADNRNIGLSQRPASAINDQM